ncbi:hypothetical protein LUZ60_011996 [Juncus effusus]|nr:hypothetical protein LUZ60_011996 [Juncus effusus]
MASASVATVNRSNSNSRTSLLFNDPTNNIQISPHETSLNRDLESLTVSNQIARNSSEKLRKRSSSIEKKQVKFLTMSIKSNGCRVCSCDELDSALRTKLLSETAEIECFSYKKNSRKGKRVENPLSPEPEFSLPDDILELILIKLPLPSLMAARCVCKKWRDLTLCPNFIQLRSNSHSYRTPWLFLFGVMRENSHTGDIHALDVSSDRWHRIIGSDRLEGRFLYSTASVKSELYIIGGCSRAPDCNPNSNIPSLRTHKRVEVFNPLSNSWRRVSSMRVARSRPVIGVFEIVPSCNLFLNSRVEKTDPFKTRLRPGTVSDVYQDPHRFSLRRQLRDAFNEDDGNLQNYLNKNNLSKLDSTTRLGLIVIGGNGSWEQQLDSGEIYDPFSDKWVEINSVPADFGPVCSGTVIGRKFYVYTETDKLASYDLDSGYWVGIQTGRPVSRLVEYNPKIVSCGARLFLICVSWCERDEEVNRREKAVRKVLELEMNKWREVSSHPDAPMDWYAVYEAHQERIYGVEMFRIFGQVLDFVTACQVARSGEAMSWRRVSRKHVAQEADPLSCNVKSLAVLRL